MGIRQRAFAQKQKSIREALEIGDGIARRERRHLLREALLGWHMRARLGCVASARFRSALASTQQRCWASWKAFHSHKVHLFQTNRSPVQFLVYDQICSGCHQNARYLPVRSSLQGVFGKRSHKCSFSFLSTLVPQIFTDSEHATCESMG